MECVICGLSRKVSGVGCSQVARCCDGRAFWHSLWRGWVYRILGATYATPTSAAALHPPFFTVIQNNDAHKRNAYRHTGARPFPVLSSEMLLQRHVPQQSRSGDLGLVRFYINTFLRRSMMRFAAKMMRVRRERGTSHHEQHSSTRLQRSTPNTRGRY